MAATLRLQVEKKVWTILRLLRIGGSFLPVTPFITEFLPHYPFYYECLKGRLSVNRLRVSGYKADLCLMPSAHLCLNRRYANPVLRVESAPASIGRRQAVLTLRFHRLEIAWALS